MLLSRIAKLYIALISLAGAATFSCALLQWQSDRMFQAFCYLALAVVSSRLKVKLPGIASTISANYLFVLTAVTCLSLPQVVLIGWASTLAQCTMHSPRRPAPAQIVFNLASSILCDSSCYAVFHSATLRALDHSMPVMLLWASCTSLLVNTILLSLVISLSEARRLWSVWRESCVLAAPHYLVGAALVWLLQLATDNVGWQATVLVLPAGYVVDRSYRFYLGRLEQEKRHVDKVAQLHLRTIRALALAIEAKDQTTHDHLRRLQVYATGIAREMGLTPEEVQALEAAALLHDIGKLAVPEYIISKPGLLTPEEFEKMKIHSLVGAEILETVDFPYPVVPLVRAHHERWDGRGYPDGLAGKAIPVGARILAAVDCLDALASERPYRPTLPLPDAVRAVAAEAGKQFDPEVIDILIRRYPELEEKTTAALQADAMPPIRARREGAPSPAQDLSPQPTDGTGDFIASIAAARQEFQALHEVTRDLGNSLSLDRTLSLLASRLLGLVPYDTIAIYVRKQERLVPQYVQGQDFAFLSSLAIPLGQGLSGWVAANNKPILNGNPSVESGYLNDRAGFTTLRSAIAVPLEGLHGVAGTLTLYSSRRDTFTRDHLRVLLAISSKAGLTIENVLRYHEAEESSLTDGLTGLPNTRSLFLHLDAELKRCTRNRTRLSLLVLDLNGFKKVNDRYGHLQGNEVLKRVAGGLRTACREYDYVARMGGDEFVVILPGMEPEAIEARCQELTGIVSSIGHGITGDHTVSLSLGAACFPEDGSDAEELLSKADHRMYLVKQQHRLNDRETPDSLPAEPALVKLAGSVASRPLSSISSGEN